MMCTVEPFTLWTMSYTMWYRRLTESGGKWLRRIPSPVYPAWTIHIPRQDIQEAMDDVTELVEEGMLFSSDPYVDMAPAIGNKETVVKALCLHVAHDCNLKCRYCFAEEGEYHGKRALMSAEVGRQALEFLVANSGKRRNLEVDFFGGEPLMNWDVVRELVAYGRELEQSHHKKFRFTLTTNGFCSMMKSWTISTRIWTMWCCR